MLPDPITSAVVIRIFTLVAEGVALRAVARLLTEEGVPSPTGRRRWVRDTIRWMVNEPRYWGAGEALGTRKEPVAKSLRARYAGKTRTVRRDPEERISIPTSAVPPLVSPDLAATAHARLANNEAHAARHNAHPEWALLRAGLARCGYCGNALFAHNHVSAGALRTVYECNSHDKGANPDCCRHGIRAHLLDAATWRAVVALLTTPGLLEGEREYLRTTERPGTDTLAAIDRLIAGLNSQIARKRRLYEGTDDEQTQDDIQREINDLAAIRRGHEVERANAQLHYADWQQQEAGIDYAIEWRDRAAGKLDRAESYAERRAILEAVHCTVRLWRADHDPRAVVRIRLPMSGEQIAAELSAADLRERDAGYDACGGGTARSTLSDSDDNRTAYSRWNPSGSA